MLSGWFSRGMKSESIATLEPPSPPRPSRSRLQGIVVAEIEGTVAETAGLTITAAGLPVPIGALVEIVFDSERSLAAEVIGFNGHFTILFPLDHTDGVRRGQRVRLRRSRRELAVGNALLGRVLDAMGKPIDSLGELPRLHARAAIDRDPPPACERPNIGEPFSTGVRAIDGLLTCGRGQRVGIFSAAGVGKSVLIGMLARQSRSEVNVIALIGERGREINEFLQNQLSEEARQRTVAIVATGDQPAVIRARAARTATAVAEHFRDQGRDVLLLMDSLTRFALAEREIALAAGEPPATRGYPGSVFARLPRLVERTGLNDKGSITAFYTVLMEADDPNDPIADAVRGHLDGHVVLSRELASMGNYPAIDIVNSVSRLADQVVDDQHRKSSATIRRTLSVYHRNRELLMLGAYRSGNDPELDRALAFRESIETFLRQVPTESTEWNVTLGRLDGLARAIEGAA